MNQHLLKLEKSLGTPLCYRKRKDCIPSEAGKVYLKTARLMLQMKEEAYNRISDITQTQKGRLSIGFQTLNKSQPVNAEYISPNKEELLLVKPKGLDLHSYAQGIHFERFG